MQPPSSTNTTTTTTTSNTSTPSPLDTSVVKKGQFDERVMKEVPAPLWSYLDSKDLYDENGEPNIAKLKSHLFKEGRIHPKDGIQLIQRAASLLRNEPNLLQLQDPITGNYIYKHIHIHESLFIKQK